MEKLKGRWEKLSASIQTSALTWNDRREQPLSRFPDSQHSSIDPAVQDWEADTISYHETVSALSEDTKQLEDVYQRARRAGETDAFKQPIDDSHASAPDNLLYDWWRRGRIRDWGPVFLAGLSVHYLFLPL